MKWVGVALLVANIGLFAWHYEKQLHARVRDVRAQDTLPLDTPGLSLLSELDRLPEAKAPASAPPRAEPTRAEYHADLVAADRCVDIGPFAVAAARDAFKGWMSALAAQMHSRSESVRRRRFFWVYLEPSSDETAQKNVSDLANSGVKDYLLIRRGEMKNAISLGLFRSQDSVNRRLAEMSKKGYRPVVVPRFDTSEQFWLAVQLAVNANSELNPPAELLGSATIRSISCAAL